MFVKVQAFVYSLSEESNELYVCKASGFCKCYNLREGSNDE